MKQYYIDTSVLLVYTLAGGKESERYPVVTDMVGMNCNCMRKTVCIWCLNPSNGKKQPVPRHMEIDDMFARYIKKYLGISDK